MTTKTLPDSRDGFVHECLFYESDDAYTSAVCDFVRAGLAAGEPVLVAVPGTRIDFLRRGLGKDAARVGFADMSELGGNPGRIIPAIREFVETHPGRRVRFGGEPIWAARSDAEIRAATRHEALLNHAFADTAMAILCPYDARLDPGVLTGAEHTHPIVTERDGRRASSSYSGPPAAGSEEPLPLPPGDAEMLMFLSVADLTLLRSVVTEHARRAGLAAGRIGELLLAVEEVAANSLQHADGSGTLRIWQTAPWLVCQVDDSGRITDPLADRRRPTSNMEHYPGLWLVHVLCDLVELRSHATGTTVRMHMHADGVADHPAFP